MQYVCENCSKVFEKAGIGAKPKFCSEGCRREWWKNNSQHKKMYSLTCSYCGNVFENHNKNQKYCSNICKAKNTSTLKNQIRACKSCNKEFTPKYKDQKYCSISCVGRSQIKWYKCKQCNKEFRLTSGGKGIFCGRECSFRYISTHKKTPASALFYDITCSICGSKFNSKRRSNKYCSDSCRREYNRIQAKQKFTSVKETNQYIKKQCPECGRTFEVNYYSSISRFCSHSCSEKYWGRVYKKQRKEQMKLAYVGPVNFRQLYIRDKGICRICGEPVAYDKTPQDPMGATIDHIIPISKGGKHHMGNCQLAHRRCNSLKGDKWPEYVQTYTP